MLQKYLSRASSVGCSIGNESVENRKGVPGQLFFMSYTNYPITDNSGNEESR